MSASDSETGVKRRSVLRGAAGAAASGIALSGTAAAQGDFGGWLSDVDNYDGTVADRTGQSEVSVGVGTEGNGGAFAFDPPAVQVDPGTTVIFEWTGEGGGHNVRATEGGDFESDTVSEAGFTFEHTFESEGVVKYQCDPHAALGMKGVVVVGPLQAGGGGDGTPSGGSGDGQPDWGNWFTGEASGGAVDNYDGTTEDLRGQSEVTVGVGTEGNGGAFAFDPPAVWIDPGTTVIFEWTGEGGGHNVVSEEGPADLDSGEAVAEPGVHYEYTFEETGINKYYCVPHLALGMKAGIAVGDDVPKAGGGADGGGGPGEGGGGRPLPGGNFGATFMGILLGSTVLAAVAVFAGEYYRALGAREEAPGAEMPEEGAGAWTGVTREIDHDEFDPVGTAWLVAVYFLILLIMWVFVYFVEFLGGGPTVIG